MHKQMNVTEKGKGLADLLKQKIEELETQKHHQKTEIEEQYKLIAQLQKNLKESIEERENEVKKLIVYKEEAEYKKPQEIQNSLKIFLRMVFRTNYFVRQLQMAQKYSQHSSEANERI